MKSATRVRVGSHNIHGGLLKAKSAIGAALRNLDILALQEADVAANISFKSPFRQYVKRMDLRFLLMTLMTGANGMKSPARMMNLPPNVQGGLSRMVNGCLFDTKLESKC